MVRNIRAHFDGRVIVPDEPVDLRPGESITVQITSNGPAQTNGAAVSAEIIQERLRRIDEFYNRPLLGNLPPEALRRESIYEDRP